MTEHPITPPPELVKQWMRVNNMDIAPLHLAQALATQAARWAADQELEACCEWLETYVQRWAEWSADFCAARRPKAPSLKEQAIEELNELLEIARLQGVFNPPNTIRRALEQLDD